MIDDVMGTALLATVVTKLVDLVRKADRNDTAAKGWWIVLPMAIGVGIAVVWQVNIFSELGLPSQTRLQGWMGWVLTGVMVGALGSGWHEAFDALSSAAKSARGNAVEAAGTGMTDLEKEKRVWGSSAPPR